MGQITIVNQHHSANVGVYVGRPTPLGNPYRGQRSGPAQALQQYRVWLRRQWQHGGAVKAALLALARAYQAQGKLTLRCWCAPQPCHAEVIREAVLGIVQHGLVELQSTPDRPPNKRGAALPTAPQRAPGSGLTLIITGARTFNDYQRLCQVLAPDRHRIAQILTGGARGAEQLGYRWAWKNAVRHQLVRPSAGVRRHHQMAQAGDVLLVLGEHVAPETAYLIRCMQRLGKPVVEVPV
jgi:Domain of unknown function (DUF4326)/YspA, cpYpsA-related SLOG family